MAPVRPTALFCAGDRQHSFGLLEKFGKHEILQHLHTSGPIRQLPAGISDFVIADAIVVTRAVSASTIAEAFIEDHQGDDRRKRVQKQDRLPFRFADALTIGLCKSSE